MKQLTGSKVSFRILELNVSAKEGGMNPRESRKWRAIGTKILDAIADYDGPVQSLIDDARDLEDLTDQEKQRAIAQINRDIRRLDDGIGQESVTVVLESEEYRFIDETWWTLKFPADRATRERIEAVSLMIEGAPDVKIEDNRVVPIERIHSNGKQRTLARR